MKNLLLHCEQLVGQRDSDDPKCDPKTKPHHLNPELKSLTHGVGTFSLQELQLLRPGIFSGIQLGGLHLVQLSSTEFFFTVFF